MIIRPIITEKSLREATKSKFTFEVTPKLRKPEIKQEIERLFGVNVTKVQTINVAGKKYRLGKKWMFALRPDWKKAVVSLKKGQKIDLFEVAAESAIEK